MLLGAIREKPLRSAAIGELIRSPYQSAFAIVTGFADNVFGDKYLVWFANDHLSIGFFPVACQNHNVVSFGTAWDFHFRSNAKFVVSAGTVVHGGIWLAMDALHIVCGQGSFFLNLTSGYLINPGDVKPQPHGDIILVQWEMRLRPEVLTSADPSLFNFEFGG